MSEPNSTELLAAVSSATDRLGDGAARIETHEQAIANRYDAVLANQYVTSYVDQENGNDGNIGTEAAPYKTLTKAISLVPRGGASKIYLMNDYHMDVPVSCIGKNISVIGTNNIKRKITFERGANGGNTHRILKGSFSQSENGAWHFSTIEFMMPSLGTYSALLPANTGIFSIGDIHGWWPLNVAMYNVSINLPAIPFTRFLTSENLVMLRMRSITYSGALTSINGWLSQDQTNTAGVDTSTLPWITTHLSTI